jgi:hypothetical protein
MFKFHRQHRKFVVSGLDIKNNLVLVEDLLTGLCIEIPCGSKELDSAEFTEEYVLHLRFKDSSQKEINLLMQGY